ncbi:MAG: hypothetical protein HS115_00230 [Spirochaetales bacterium]|nr:hypothetical protein [Spirochaetales bacterium]
MADTDLEDLLSNPFPSAPGASIARKERVQSKGRDDFTFFRAPADIAFQAHLMEARRISAALFDQIHSPAQKSIVEKNGGPLRKALDEITKKYRIYILTATDDVLEKEALRLERRYFEKKAERRELEFIKLKRYYEKVKTYHELARGEWRVVQRTLDTLALMPETRGLAASLAQEALGGIQDLLRHTDSFLEAIKLYMQAESETLDGITATYRLTVSYSPKIIYTIRGFLGEEVEEEKAPEKEPEPAADEDVDTGSLARSIILETRERKLNQASIYSAKMRGSRDWNRTPAYSLEVPVRYYDECVRHFQKAYQVFLDQEARTVLNPSQAEAQQGLGKEMLGNYVKTIRGMLDAIAEKILTVDFPGLGRPDVFLYHCGPNVVYEILLKKMNQAGIGEINYFDDAGSNVVELPEELLKKLLIDWWEIRMQTVSGEDVDSYLSYSRALEMVKKEYRALVEVGSRKYREENAMASYTGLEKWLRDNRYRVFGLEKTVVFIRFIPESFLS